MGTLKYKVGSAMASASLLLAPVAPVAASENGYSNGSDTTNSYNITVTNTTDESETINIGECAISMRDIRVELDQRYNDQENDDQDNDDPNRVSGDVDDESGVNQSNTNNQNQSNTRTDSQSVVITLAPDCSVTNVHHAAASGGQGGGAAGGRGGVLGASAEAGKGGVGAGFGGTAASLAATVGAVGSVLGAGLGLRRFGR